MPVAAGDRAKRGKVGARRIAVLVAATGLLAATAGIAAGQPAPVTLVQSGTPCPAHSACIDVLSQRSLGPVRLVAQGFLHGVDVTTNPALVMALHPQSWRVSDDGDAYVMGHTAGARVTSLLSDLWYDATYSPATGSAQAPWANWTAYRRFIVGVVEASRASGQHIDYWEIQNEPDGFYGHVQPPTTAQALEQFRVASEAIRSVDPSARIVGPSLTRWLPTAGGPALDMRTFLDYVVAHHLKLDAISWHEVDSVPGTTGNPSNVETHVAQARALLAARPSLGHPAIFVNEYGAVANHLIPGWSVAWIDALEKAGVDQANRACWHGPDVTGRRIAECDEGSLDGLFVPASGVPQALYYVYRAYADMAGGTRLATTTTDPYVTAFASRSAANVVRILVGRHQSCTATVRPDCNEPASATPAPINVVLRIGLPPSAVAAALAVERIPNFSGAVAGTQPILSAPITPTDGILQVPLLRFADGDAYLITVTLQS